MTIWDGSQPWIATSYAQVKTVLSDARFSADVRNPSFPLVSGDKREKDGGTFIRLDDPEHGCRRRMLAADFTVRMIAKRSTEIERITRMLIDEMLAGPRPTDLISSFALPLPSLVICSILGVPYSDRDAFQRFTAINVDSAATLEQKKASADESREYYGSLLIRKRAAPGDDLISKLLSEAQGISDDELIGMVSLLVSAGHETTANQIGLGVLALLESPDQLALLRADASLVDNTVEEMLRYWSIVAQNPRRVAIDDVEVDAQVVRRGEGVVTSLCTANRDPEVFGKPLSAHGELDTRGSDLERIDISRVNARRHLAFGFGVHQCLGQNLARLELRIAWTELFDRIPDLRLAVAPGDLAFKQTTQVFGLYSLPVTWGN